LALDGIALDQLHAVNSIHQFDESFNDLQLHAHPLNLAMP
jgi:hypothetical protein